jgi:fibronectin type 3 domain-containing protein
MREDGMGERNNPCDPGGSAWTENAQPEITVTIDSRWSDFDHTQKRGSISFHLEGFDRNFPYDSVSGSVVVNSTVMQLPIFAEEGEFTTFIGGLKQDTTYRCTLFVYDTRKDTVVRVLEVPTPDGLPPYPPSASVTSGTKVVTISWKWNDTISQYIVYYSSEQDGPFDDSIFDDSITVKQSDDTIITVTDTPEGYTPIYYIVAAVNEYGVSRSNDTLLGRIYSTSVTSPKISEISKGGYYTHISLSIYVSSYYSADYLELYRSTSTTGTFRLISTIPVRNTSYYYYNDSVTTADTIYYMATLVDDQGRCSAPGIVVFGYLRRLPQPSGFALSPENDRVSLSWSRVTGASYYRVYRSQISCSEGFKLLDTTSASTFTDTPPTASEYYYTVIAVDDAGNEGVQSDCRQGKMLGLPAPGGFYASNGLYPYHVALGWDAVSGADGYVIYRDSGLLSSVHTPLDTIDDTVFIDSLSELETWYYLVAAYDDRGTGVLSERLAGTILTPSLSAVTSYEDSILITWGLVSNAIAYYIYRSTDSTEFELIDSSLTTRYMDRPDDFGTYYYRITIRVPEGVSLPGNIMAGNRKPGRPENLQATDLENGVLLTWNSVDGAEKYEVYRSESESGLTLHAETTDTFFMDTPSSTSRYYYRIAAKNGEVKSIITDAVRGGKLGPPLVPASVSITSNWYSIKLTWDVHANSPEPDGFYIYRLTPTSGTFVLIDSTSTHEYSDTVSDTLQYFYMISAYNAYGEGPQSAQYSESRSRPPYPSRVRASDATSKDHIMITWQAVSTIHEYGVYRSMVSTGLFNYIGSAFDTTLYYDTTCNVSTHYYYIVASIVPGSTSDGSSSDLGIRLGPPEPGGCEQEDAGIRVIWLPLWYEVEYYNVYRSGSAYGPYTKIGSTPYAGTSYLDSNPLPDTNFYKLSSFNQEESDFSIIATVYDSLPVPEPPLTVTASKGTEFDWIALNWSTSDNATSYKLYRAPTDTFDRDVKLIVTITSTSYVDEVTSDSIYYYKVTAVNGNGESGFSERKATPGYRYPSRKAFPPLSLYIGSTDNKIGIGWEAPSTAVGYSGFSIYRATSVDGVSELVGETSGLFFTDIPPESDPTIYWYHVTTVNQMGESAPSEKISASMKQ